MITQATIEAYKANRKPQVYWAGTKQFIQTAKIALSQVRYAEKAACELKAFEEMGGYMCAEYEAPESPEQSSLYTGQLRILQIPDEHMSFDDLTGDTYNADVNPDVPKHVMDKQRQAEIDRIDSEGVYGHRAEYWDGSEWIETDSIWGFVGDDFQSSGYDGDLMSSAMEGLREHHKELARELEATRPDMYAIV